MNPTMMLTLLVSAWAAFAWSANRRWQLLKVGRSENRLDNIGRRLKMLYEYALVQKKMSYYPLAGLAHKLIFLGFSVLLLGERCELGGARRAQRRRRALVQDSLLLARRQRGATVLAAVGQLLDRALLELHVHRV